jgi:hypothetical protein
MVTMRMPADLIANVEGWAKSQDDLSGRSAAIRRLVEIGLTIGAKASPSQRLRTVRAYRAKDIIDPTAPPEERAQRRRRLTKGPEEFREVRVDRQKK